MHYEFEFEIETMRTFKIFSFVIYFTHGQAFLVDNLV